MCVTWRVGGAVLTANYENSEVFISYSHKDKEWLDRLRVHLRPLEREHSINIWDDTKINPGSNWREEIRNALSNVKIAILLVSADFLASDFIANNELPSLLEAAEQKGAIIISIIISPSRFTHIEKLSQFQAINDPAKPLIELSKVEQESILVKVSERIEEILSPSQEKTTENFKITPQREIGNPWGINISSITYLNVPRITMEMASQGSLPDIPNTQLDMQKGFIGSGFELAYVLRAFKDFFKNSHPRALDLSDPKTLKTDNIGAMVTFNNTFRTKNVPYPDKVEEGKFKFKGNFEKDPHIYCKIDGKKVYLPIDPIWITTSTAFVDFSSGIKRFAGLGLLKDIRAREAVISPFVIGQPKPALALGW